MFIKPCFEREILVDSLELRKVWGKFPTGVTIMSSLDDDGSIHSMTANAVCSVSLDPPLCLVCVSFNRHSHKNIKDRAVFSISFLRSDQTELAKYFAVDHEERDGKVNPKYITPSNSIPILADCIANISCRVKTQHQAGDHTIFIAEIIDANIYENATNDALVFYESKFTTLIK